MKNKETKQQHLFAVLLGPIDPVVGPFFGKYLCYSVHVFFYFQASTFPSVFRMRGCMWFCVDLLFTCSDSGCCTPRSFQNPNQIDGEILVVFRSVWLIIG